MKKIVLSLVLVIGAASVHAQNIAQKLSEKVTVQFPAKPSEKTMNGATIFYVADKDTSKGFGALVFDLSAMGLMGDPIEMMGDSFWDQLKAGMSSQMAGANISKDLITRFKEKNSLYVEIDGTNSSDDNLKGKKAFGYIFFIGPVLHQVLFYSTNPSAKAADGQAFFDSVEIGK
ncbi:hypothetical protein [Sediminibacterium sp.]|uniref:hypothetical protein n=1 Tax=Sediminibacterium sp. TaxID=1917865 RepID=UPI003F711901